MHAVQAQLDEARKMHSRKMEGCEQQAAAAIKAEREVCEREREQWKQYHQRHIEVEREERQRLEARVKILEAKTAHLQEQNEQLEKSCALARGAPRLCTRCCAAPSCPASVLDCPCRRAR